MRKGRKRVGVREVSERGVEESGIDIGEEESGSEIGEEEWRKDNGWE